MEKTLELPAKVFWDTDVTKLDLEQNRIAIIDRILNYGNAELQASLFDYYGNEAIKASVVKIPYINPRLLKKLKAQFNLKTKDFLCSQNMVI